MCKGRERVVCEPKNEREKNVTHHRQASPPITAPTQPYRCRPLLPHHSLSLSLLSLFPVVPHHCHCSPLLLLFPIVVVVPHCCHCSPSLSLFPIVVIVPHYCLAAPPSPPVSSGSQAGWRCYVGMGAAGVGSCTLSL